MNYPGGCKDPASVPLINRQHAKMVMAQLTDEEKLFVRSCAERKTFSYAFPASMVGTAAGFFLMRKGQKVRFAQMTVAFVGGIAGCFWGKFYATWTCWKQLAMSPDSSIGKKLREMNTRIINQEDAQFSRAFESDLPSRSNATDIDVPSVGSWDNSYNHESNSDKSNDQETEQKSARVKNSYEDLRQQNRQQNREQNRQQLQRPPQFVQRKPVQSEDTTNETNSGPDVGGFGSRKTKYGDVWD